MDHSVSSELAGQVVHLRRKNKKMCFYDVIETETRTRTSALMKSWFCGEDEMKRAHTSADDRIRVGDIVRFLGQWEEEEEKEKDGGRRRETSLFAVKTFSLLDRFRVSHPNEQFASIPPPSSDAPASTSSASDDRARKVCKFWVNSGRCPRERCHFLHLQKGDELTTQARTKYVSDRLSHRASLQQREEHEEIGDLASRHQRASIFADWLGKKNPQIFSEKKVPLEEDEPLNEIVLDIAGGRGDLAFELSVKRKLVPPVVIVDPRGQKVRRWQSKLMKKRETGNNNEEETKKMLPAHVEALFDEDFFERREIAGNRIRMVIGMHPDEATEPLVDLSLSKSLPFAVIPCCVFAHCSPHRRLKDGQEPTTYEQFCQFLMEKHPGIEKERLGFRGRDTVLYWTGSTSGENR